MKPRSAQITDAIGFRYQFDDRDKSVCARQRCFCRHAAGKLARYFYGIEYAPRDLRLGLIEAGGQQDRIACRSVVAFLLPLRSGDRKVWRGRDEDDAGWRSHHVGGDRRFVARLAPAQPAA